MPSAAIWISMGLMVSLTLTLACGEGAAPGFVEPVHRFSGPRQVPGSGVIEVPMAALGNDTRTVLRARASGHVHSRKAAPVEDGGIAIRARLKGPFRSARRILTSVAVSDGATRRALPQRLVETRVRDGRRVLEMTVDVPTELAAGGEVSYTVYGTAIGPENLAAYRSSPVEIPERARLDFAIGILEPDAGGDPVEFVLSACAEADCEAVFSEVLDPSREDARGWHDRSVELGSLAGGRHRFLFETRRLAEDSPVSLPVWAHPTVYAPARREPDAVNLVLLSIDTLRADHLPSYGYDRETAPFLDERFARGGVLFENCVAASTVTTPSHMTMFTGVQPIAHGITDGHGKLPPGLPTLTEVVRASGIATAAVTENGGVSVYHGFARGFDSFVENKSAEVMKPEGHVEATFARAQEWLEHNGDKRFFLFLHTYQVHNPYVPPERYRDLFAEPAGEEAPELVRLMADYDREIRFTDDALREFYAFLEEHGLARNTLFVVTSDHGEAFMEHGLLYHGGQLYEEALAVPLLLAGPGIPAGRRIVTPVGHRDLMPLLLDLLGVASPPGLAPSEIAVLLREGDAPATTGRPQFSETWVRYQAGLGSAGRRFEPPSFAVRRGRGKLARYRDAAGHRYELYDLAADPGERRDLSGEALSSQAALVKLLDGYERRQEAEGARLLGGRRVRREAPPAVHPDAERAAKLRALGYVE